MEMEIWQSEKQKDNAQKEEIKELKKALKKCLNIWGRGYEPKEGVQDTIGSLLYAECKELIK